MKKIFRMALVFALAGATLMYTGCTKDYSEDINNVESEVNALESTINGLKQDVDALKSSVSALESAYKAADAALQKGIDANAAAIKGLQDKVAANESAIAKLEAASKTHATKDELKAAVDDLKAQIAANKAEILKVTDALQADVKALKEKLTADEATIAANAEAIKALQEAQAKINDVYAALSNLLTSIVFLPDFYFAGIEATSFDIAEISSFRPIKNTADIKSGIYTFPKTAKVEFEEDYVKNAKTPAEKYPNDYSLSQIGIANYNINPSTFNVEEAEWALYGMDRKYVVKADEAKTWAPVFEGISVKDGVASVNYSIANPELLLSTVEDAFALESENSESDTVAVMKLVATVDNKEVASDWHAIIPGVEAPDHLAFAKGNANVTLFEEDCEIFADKVKDLYLDAVTAAEDTASVFAKYNGGAIDLAELVNIHVAAGEDFAEYTLAEWAAKYPGFTMNFELVPYTIGDNVTGEDYYGQIKGSEFTPCYVESKAGKPQSIAIEKDAEAGISAVGRMPIVLVTLKDEAGIVAAYGYFKIQITKDAPKPVEPKFFDVPSFGKVPFICSEIEKTTEWHQFSFFVLEALGVDYEQFVANYTFDSVWAYEMVRDEKTKKDVEKFIELDPQNKYGEITYTQDSKGSGINDKFSWVVSPTDLGEGESKDVYLKFVGPSDIIYFKLTAEVADAAAFDFGANKLANEWYADIDNEPMNTVRVNVLVPNATDDDVTEYYRDLNRFYIGYKPGVALAKDADPIYAEVAKDKELKAELETESTFYFSAEQPVINGLQLVASEDGASLYVAAYDDKGKMVTEKVKIDGGKDVVVPVLYDSLLIATIDESVITYSWEEGPTAAKELLNLWSYNEKDQAKMLYANIIVKTTYGECEIPAGDENFHVRFLRPLDVNFQSQDVAQESEVGGANVTIAKFISGIVDWNKQSVIVDSLDKNKKPTGNMIENVIKGVNMYEYYQFEKIIVDLENAERDNYETSDLTLRGLISKITPEVELALGTVDEDDIFTEGSSNEIDITSFDNLKTAAINYKNGRSNVETFNIFIPVTVEYAWGSIEAELVIKVKPTSETDPK